MRWNAAEVGRFDASAQDWTSGQLKKRCVAVRRDGTAGSLPELRRSDRRDDVVRRERLRDLVELDP